MEKLLTPSYQSHEVVDPTECSWCFDNLRKSRVSVYGFIFCSANCAFRFKEFEDQIRKNF